MAMAGDGVYIAGRLPWVAAVWLMVGSDKIFLDFYLLYYSRCGVEFFFLGTRCGVGGL